MIALGNRADLILTDTNPLEDLSTLRKPVGVMASGHWYTATTPQTCSTALRNNMGWCLIPVNRKLSSTIGI